MPERLRAWVLAMRWHDLLFAHWPIPAERLRALVPPQLELDTFGGSAWLGIVPFRMSHVRARGLPPLPGASAFPELNVRTYVHRRGHAGVWFFSLDASHRLAVRTARALFALPYFDADMRCARAADGSIEYACRRTHRGAPAAAFAARYGPIGEVAHAEPGSLAHFLTARFCLFTAGARGAVRRCDIAHAPWPLQPARWEPQECAMTKLLGIALPASPPILHFARRVDVRAAWPRRARP
jgi:uncharacterized protein YqjF (DUF2071 family)